MVINFRKHFENRILRRGYEYFKNGAIKAIEIMDDEVKAIVSGTEDYEVELSLEGNNLVDSHCDCPYAESGENCKHMAAVLYYLEEKPNIELREEHTKQALDIIGKLDKKLLKNFISEILKTDDEALNKFRLEFLEYFPVSITEYKNRIRSVFDSLDAYGNYINFRMADNFLEEIQLLIEEAKKHVSIRHYSFASEIIILILEEIVHVDILDPDECLEMVVSSCIELLEHICDFNPNDCDDVSVAIDLVADFIFDDLASDILICYDVQVGTLLESIVRKSNNLEEIENNLHYILNEDLGEEDRRRYQDCIFALLLLYEKTNQVEKAIKLMQENLNLHKVLSKYVVYLLEENHSKEAIEGIKVAIIANNGNDAAVEQLLDRLLSIYKEFGMDKEYREELNEAFFGYYKYDLSVFKKIKELYSPKQWESKSKSILDKIQKTYDKRYFVKIAEIYAEEKRVDDLLKLLIEMTRFQN